MLALALPCAARADAPEPAPPERRSADWSEVEVWQVIGDAAGSAIVLLRTTNPERRIIVPIAVGPSEALAIRLKLAGTSYIRPLTHDLLEGLVRQLGARVVKVRIEKLAPAHAHDAGTFFGRVFVRHGRRTLDLDARASDSIAIALRAGAPIFVATRVLERSGLDVRRFEAGDVEAPVPLQRAREPAEPL
jgi:bifunctional DNase/RNase